MRAAVIYCRKSLISALPTDVSFDDQEKCCREYAADHRYQVHKVYREAHSGADLLNRPMIWDAIDDVKRGDADLILVRNYDRLARKPEHQAVILFEVEEKYKGKVESALDPLDEEDTNAKTTRGILAVVAEAERLNAVARMQRGKMRRKERGELTVGSNPLYGYTWLDDEPRKRTTYTIDPETAGVVQRIFLMVNAGHSLRSIARLLNAEKVPTPAEITAKNDRIGRHRVGNFWRAEQIRRIVTCKTYVGNGGNTPEVIDQKHFEMAQHALQVRETGRPPADAEATWLRHHVYCGVCKKRMSASRDSRTGKYVFYCRNRPSSAADRDRACAGGDFGIRAYLLDQPVYEHLSYMLMKRDEVRELMLNQLGRGKLERLVAMAESYQEQIRLKREEKDRAKIRSRQTSDDDLAREYLEDAERLMQEIRTLEEEYAATREELEDANADVTWAEATLQAIYDDSPLRPIPYPEDVKAFPYPARRLLLAALGVRVEVYPKGWPAHERVEVFSSWEMRQKVSHNTYAVCQLKVTIWDLLDH